MESETLEFTEDTETVSQEDGFETEEAAEPEETQEETAAEEIAESEEYLTQEDVEALLAEFTEAEETETELVTLWNKPLTDYSPTEGLLLVIMILLLWLVISRQIGGRFK